MRIDNDTLKFNTYYISQSEGDDGYDGLAGAWDGKHGPWKTLSKASEITLYPGDKLLLKCGDSWNETLTPTGRGDSCNPIIISSYGHGERPYIKKTLSNVEDRCIMLNKVMGYKIIGLELGQAWYGIEIAMDNSVSVDWDYYWIEDCFFHDIINEDFPHDQSNGPDLSGWPWAICRRLNEASNGCVITNLTVKNCFSTRCQGFYNTQYSEAGSGSGSISEVNTLFDGNTFQYCYYNNIYMCNSTNSTMKNCLMFFGYPNKNVWPYGNAFIISGSPDKLKPTVGNTIINNEFGWVGDIPGGVDGCFYDLEFSQSDTRIQKNYVHNAFGEGFLTMGYANISNLFFDNNIVKDVLKYCSNRNMAIDIISEGTGTYSNNKFFLEPSQCAFNKKPAGYSFISNDEYADGSFVSMPIVSNIDIKPNTRTYSFESSTPGAVLRYTTDASIPKADSHIYNGPITVSKSCVINIKAFKEGEYDSYTNSILVDFKDSEGKKPGVWLEEIENKINSNYSDTNTAYGLVESSDNFSISFCVRPNELINHPTETCCGISGMEGQCYALFPMCRGGGPDNNHAGVGISVGTNGISVFEHSDDYMPAVLTEKFEISDYVHIAIVYRDKQPHLFVNGEYKKAGFRSSKVVHPVFKIFASEFGIFTGDLKDLRVYDYPITHAQVQEIFITQNK